jgi:hypothetical protein
MRFCLRLNCNSPNIYWREINISIDRQREKSNTHFMSTTLFHKSYGFRDNQTKLMEHVVLTQKLVNPKHSLVLTGMLIFAARYHSVVSCTLNTQYLISNNFVHSVSNNEMLAYMLLTS